MVYHSNNIDCFFERIGKLMTELEILTRIANSLDILVLFAILNFATSCMRGWRRNVIRGLG